MNVSLDALAQRYEQAAAELERAAQHLRTSARHVRSQEGARIGAHAFAAYGHLRRAHQLLDDLASVHADKSRPD